MNYSDYLDTEHWKETRTKIRRRARGWCERCRVGKRTDVHHLAYDNLGNEKLDDLIAVCTPCHEYLHGKRDKDPAAIKYTPEEVKAIRFCTEMFCYGLGTELENALFARRPGYIESWKKREDSLMQL